MADRFGGLFDDMHPPGSSRAEVSSLFDGLTPPAAGWEDVSPTVQRRRKPDGSFEYRPTPQFAGAETGVGATPKQTVGDRALALGDRAVTAAAEGIAAIPELAASLPELFLPSGVSVAPDASIYPTIGEPGGFLDLRAQREDIRRQNEAARERLLASDGDPAIIAAADSLAEAAGMAVPIPGVAAAAEARAARPAGQTLARAAEDLTAEEAAYLARRAKIMPTIPGAEEPFVGPGALQDALRPESEVLQVGAHANDASRDAALGLRASREEAEELARKSLAIDEGAAPSVSRGTPPPLEELFDDLKPPVIDGHRPNLEPPDSISNGAVNNIESLARPSSIPLIDTKTEATTEPILRNLLTHEELPLDTPRTGTKNAVTDAERLARGLPEVEAIARKSSGDTWAEARTLFEQDPDAARALAARIAEKPRALTPVENDLLLHDRMKLTLDHRELLTAEDAALQAGDEEAAALAKMRRQEVETAMERNDEAVRRAGTEWALSGIARQKLIAENYSPLYLRQRLVVAARETNQEVHPAEVERLAQLSRDIEQAQAKLAEYESRLSEVEAQRNVAAAAREEGKAVRAGKRRATREQLDQEYGELAAMLDKKARVNQQTAYMSGGLDPETVGIIARMARNRVRAGVNNLPELVQGIHETIAPHIPDLEPVEVRDAISGYGVVRGHASQSEAEKTLSQIRQQARLVSRIEAIQAGEGLPVRGPRPAPAPETAALREKLRQTVKDLGANPTRTDAQRLAATKQRLERQIADAERGIGPTRRTKAKDTPEITALRKKLDEILEEHGLSRERTARQMTDEQRLAALKARLVKREAELAQGIATGSFPKKVRRPLSLDHEAIALQGRVNELKKQADLIIRQKELAARTGAEKAMDNAAGFGRFLKLSGVATLQKISAAASERALVFKPIEELLGAGWSKAPVVKHFAREAPIEGGGSVRAIAKSYAGFFGETARKELAAGLRGKEGPFSLGMGHGHGAAEVPAWMEYPGRVHAGLKAPAKIAGFEYAIQKQAEYYLANGQAEKLADEAVIADMKAKAWEYANRDIFMGDNAFVRRFRRFLSNDPGQSLAAKAGTTAGNILFPIVKVPTNYALEVTDYALGLPKAAGRMANVARRGMKATRGDAARDLAAIVHAGLQQVPEGQAELIMRQLKKGSLGAGLIALGATGAIEAGGYYDGPRSHSELHAGNIRVLGVSVPHMILHHPAFEALQIGATIHRARTLEQGVGNAAWGVAEQVPFFEEPVAAARDLRERPAVFFGSIERGMTIPPDVQRLARILDQRGQHDMADMILQQFGWKDIDAKKRRTRGPFLEQLYEQEMLGIPGLRDDVR